MTTQQLTKEQIKAKQRLYRKKTLKQTWILYLFILPALAYILIFCYGSMFGLQIAFKNYRAFRPNTFWNNIVKSEWVGLKNFEFLNSPDTGIMIRNTLGYNILWIILGLIISVAFAVMMSELTTRFLAKTYQTMMFFPYFLSWVVVSYFLNAFLDAQYGMLPAMEKLSSQVSFFFSTK